MSAAVAPAVAVETPETPETASASRLVRVRELWTASRENQLEIGRLLYEERLERLSVGGRGLEGGFQSWLRDAGIPAKSAYRRIAEYEVSIGVRVEPEKPVSGDTGLGLGHETIVEHAIQGLSQSALYRLRAALNQRLNPDAGQKKEKYHVTPFSGVNVDSPADADADVESLAPEPTAVEEENVTVAPAPVEETKEKAVSKETAIELVHGALVHCEGMFYRVVTPIKGGTPRFDFRPEDNPPKKKTVESVKDSAPAPVLCQKWFDSQSRRLSQLGLGVVLVVPSDDPDADLRKDCAIVFVKVTGEQIQNIGTSLDERK